MASDHFNRRSLQNLHTREAVRAISALSYHHACHTHTRLTASVFDRYSNTLLVSLNNRISIRDTYGSRRGAVDCQATTFPSIGTARSDATTDRDAVHLECQKQDLVRHTSAGANWNSKDERVVSCESREVFFKVADFLILPESPLSSSLGYRHGMILITRIWFFFLCLMVRIDGLISKLATNRRLLRKQSLN